MISSTRVRRALLVIGASVAGVLAAGALVAGALRVSRDEDGPTGASSPAALPSTVRPSGSGPGSSSSCAESAGSGQDNHVGSTPVTIDVPRSERTPVPGLRPEPVPQTSGSSPVAVPISLTDPESVASAYVVAAETVTANDAGARHHRAERYMALANPAIASGLLVTEPPPPGHARTIEVLSIAEHARNDDIARIAYMITYQRHLSPAIPATTTMPEGPARVTYVVVERQAAGDWLVLSQIPELDPAD
jgi:hypothetical protein